VTYRFRRPLRLSATLGLLALAACDSSTNQVVVATAADREFTVDQAVELLVQRTDLAIDTTVIGVVSDLWIDYTLFAHAFGEDSTLSQLDFSPLTEPQLEQEMILSLRDAAVDADTAISQAELAEMFAREAPGVTARARHILLVPPQGATQEQRDSVRTRAEALRDRIVGGEDFAEIARQFSADRGSGRQGGSLGVFGRGQFVRPLDEAIFSLDVGEIGPIVQSPLGYHIVQLQELDAPSFDSVADGFRLQVQGRRIQAAESTFIAGLQDAAAPDPEAGAAELLRSVASDPRTPLTGRTGDRVVARYVGGRVTLEEVREFFLTRDPQYLAQVREAPDDVLEEQVVTTLVQRELLVEEARRRGLEPTAARRDSITQLARERFVQTGRQLGLVQVERSDDRPDGASRAVRAIVGGIVSGQREVAPLGPIAYVLREHYRNGVSQVGVRAAVARVEEIRGPDFVPAVPEVSNDPPDVEPAEPDTAAREDSPAENTPEEPR
jgi:parvulin-like peptidyl-prolyl isomerase